MGLNIGDLVTHIIHRNGIGIVVKVSADGGYPYCIRWPAVNASLFVENWYKKESLIRV